MAKDQATIVLHMIVYCFTYDCIFCIAVFTIKNKLVNWLSSYFATPGSTILVTVQRARFNVRFSWYMRIHASYLDSYFQDWNKTKCIYFQNWQHHLPSIDTWPLKWVHPSLISACNNIWQFNTNMSNTI